MNQGQGRRRRKSKAAASSSPAKRPRQPRRRRQPRAATRVRRWLAALTLLVLIGAVPVLALWRWAHRQTTPQDTAHTSDADSRSPISSNGPAVSIRWPEGLELGDGAELLSAAGFQIDAQWFGLYASIFASSEVEPGQHTLRRDLTVAELVQCLRRSPRRPAVRVSIPEGWNVFQIAERLAQLSVVSRSAFLEAALADTADTDKEAPLGDHSWEGKLFPASYDLYLNSRPEQILRRLADEMDKRWRRLVEQHGEAWRRLQERHGWSRHEALTLASMVQAEGADEQEFPRIASVFFNRLRDPAFKPSGMLQSDPTAGYGCLLGGDSIQTCVGYSGRIKPSMLRDGSNRYNTYRHPGLPPGPIANPGEAALRAVLAPEQTEFFYFFADGHGRHRFSRNLAEHERAIAGD